MTLAASGAGTPLTEHLDSDLQRLDRACLEVAADIAARELLGAMIVRDDDAGRRIARIVETEAYAGPDDRASHARAGRTPRTQVMFGPPGHAYVYLVYGMHHCLNVVCGADGQAAAVLIRAVEPVVGVAAMRAARQARPDPDGRLAAGPARTCQALAIDRRLDGVDLLTDERLWLVEGVEGRVSDRDVLTGPRVGVDHAGPGWADRPWRFGLAGSPALSKPFPGST